MIVGFDATFLLYLFAPAGSVGTPLDSVGQPIAMAKERIEALVKDLEKQRATIIVGTPALSEIMVRASIHSAQAWIAIMNKSPFFNVVPFDAKSAIEVAEIAGNSVKGESLKFANNETQAKLKYDRQIVAIAHTEGAKYFYSDDERQRNLATRLGMLVRGLADCPIPDKLAQQKMFEGKSPEDSPELRARFTEIGKELGSE